MKYCLVSARNKKGDTMHFAVHECITDSVVATTGMRVFYFTTKDLEAALRSNVFNYEGMQLKLSSLELISDNVEDCNRKIVDMLFKEF